MIDIPNLSLCVRYGYTFHELRSLPRSSIPRLLLFLTTSILNLALPTMYMRSQLKQLVQMPHSPFLHR